MSKDHKTKQCRKTTKLKQKKPPQSPNKNFFGLRQDHPSLLIVIVIDLIVVADGRLISSLRLSSIGVLKIA